MECNILTNGRQLLLLCINQRHQLSEQPSHRTSASIALLTIRSSGLQTWPPTIIFARYPPGGSSTYRNISSYTPRTMSCLPTSPPSPPSPPPSQLSHARPSNHHFSLLSISTEYLLLIWLSYKRVHGTHDTYPNIRKASAPSVFLIRGFVLRNANITLILPHG
jgi:hypothetical protein